MYKCIYQAMKVNNHVFVLGASILPNFVIFGMDFGTVRIV